jgi:hypothetical protein
MASRRAIMTEESAEAHKQRRPLGRLLPFRRPRDGGDWHPAFAGMTIGPTPFDRDPFLMLIHAPVSIGAPPEIGYTTDVGGANGARR